MADQTPEINQLPDAEVTVAQIVALIERTKQSLSEAGRSDLADACHAVITADGTTKLRFIPLGPPLRQSSDVVLKALSLDPTFEHADREPLPSDGPDYHADHAAWESRKSLTGTADIG